MGLTMRDLWYSTETMTPTADTRWRDEKRLEWVLGWQSVHAWLGTEDEALNCEEAELIFKLYPARKAAYDLQHRIKTEGWEKLWEEYLRQNPQVERNNPVIQKLQISLF
jgi:hypothetical protein